MPVEVYRVPGQATELLVLHIRYCSENGRLSEVPTSGASVPAIFAVHTMIDPFGRNDGVHDPEEFTVPVDPMPVVVTVNPFVGTPMYGARLFTMIALNCIGMFPLAAVRTLCWHGSSGCMLHCDPKYCEGGAPTNIMTRVRTSANIRNAHE